ncbi:MAG TPA: trigger factor [Gemmatimonadota bacterium]|jgi:trigger factor
MGSELDTLTGPNATAAPRVRAEVEELPRWRRRLTFEAPPERVREERERVTRDYAKRLRLPGFRPGHAPADLVRQRFRADIERDLVRALVQTGIEQAIEEHGLEPLAAPVIQSLDLDAGDTLRATAEIDVRPRLTLDRVGGFDLERPATEVPPDATDRVLDRLREERAELRPVERPAARGDVVVVDVAPEIGEGEVQTYEILLGAGRADPRVEEQLEGARAGEERTLALDDPAAATSAPPDAPSAARRFRVRTREVRERLLPALDDAFAAAVSREGTLPELRARIGANLAEEAETRAERELRERLLDAIAEANRVEVPESMVETYVERLLHPAPAAGAARGSARPAEAGLEHGSEEHDRLAQALRPAAERSLRRHLIVEAVARAEGLEPTDEQIDAYLGERVAEGGSVAETRRGLERRNQLEDLRGHLRAENVFAHLKSQSTIRPAGASSDPAR